MRVRLVNQKTCLIHNATAGMFSQLPLPIQRLQQCEWCESHSTEGPGDAEKLARLAVQQGVQRIIVAGGDGTVSQVVDGISPDFAHVELAILPLGTGNDLARSLGIPLDDLDAAVELAISDRVTPIDIVRVSAGIDSYMVNAASAGFGGKVAADVNQFDKARWGPFAYWTTAVAELVDVPQFDVHLDMDGQHRHTPVYGLVVANGRFVGGGFPIAPDALLNDGLLDVTIIPALPTLELLAAGLNFMLHRQQGTDHVATYRARSVHVHTTPEMMFSIDGEPTERIDADFEILPKALNIVAAEQPTTT